MNTTHLAHHFRDATKMPPPAQADQHTTLTGHGFVLLATNAAGEVLIEYQINAQWRLQDLRQNHGLQLFHKRHVYSLRAQLIVDQMQVDFFHQRVEPGSTFYNVTWADANQKLDELLGLLPPAGAERGRLAA